MTSRAQQIRTQNILGNELIKPFLDKYKLDQNWTTNYIVYGTIPSLIWKLSVIVIDDQLELTVACDLLSITGHFTTTDDLRIEQFTRIQRNAALIETSAQDLLTKYFLSGEFDHDIVSFITILSFTDMKFGSDIV